MRFYSKKNPKKIYLKNKFILRSITKISFSFMNNKCKTKFLENYKTDRVFISELANGQDCVKPSF